MLSERGGGVKVYARVKMCPCENVGSEPGWDNVVYRSSSEHGV